MNKLVTRAPAAARSARLLLDEGDTIGAVSRAYYAMFDLARAALRDIDPNLAAAKTHATIISRFSKHMVQDRGFPQELGRALRRAFDARLSRTIPTQRPQSKRPGRWSTRWINFWPQ
jgi:uncharacterized protein (UPF0332 family)